MRMMPYVVVTSAPKLSSWTAASVSPASARTATTGIADVENLFTTASAAPSRDRRIAISGASAPSQYAMPTPCRNIAGRVRTCGGAVAAWPLAASDSPTPSMAIADSVRPARALCIADMPRPSATIAINNDGPRLVPSAIVHGAEVARRESGSPSRSRPCNPSDATTLTMPIASAARMNGEATLSRAIQLTKKVPPTPANRPR